jgi:tetratricopeptide (TPR) repeat protein
VDSADLLSQARESFKYGQFERAAELARKSLAEDATNADAASLLGSALSRLGQNEAAESALKDAIRFEPNDARHRYNLAAHYFVSGDIGSAEQLAQQAVVLEPQHQSSLDLLSRIKGDPEPLQPSPFDRTVIEPPETPLHSMPFLASLGWAWNVLGIFFFGAFAITHFALVRLVGSQNVDQSNQAAMERLALWLVQEHAPLMFGFLVWYGLLAIWWVVDLFDRRPPAGLVTASAVGIIGACCYLHFLLFPLYLFLRSHRGLRI